METKKKIDYNLLLIIASAIMGILMLASYFIPVITPSERYNDIFASYSCRDIVVAMNAEDSADLKTESIEEAYRAISEEKTGSTDQEKKAGKLVKIIGIIGMINAMLGAVITVCALSLIFIKSSMVKFLTIGLAGAGLAIAIAIIAMTTTYLGLPTGAGTYAYYSSIGVSAFVMLGASIASGVATYFIGKMPQNNQ